MSHLSASGSFNAGPQGSQLQYGRPSYASNEASRPPQRSWASGEHLGSLANLAHELRTPVQVLFGYLDILRDDVPEFGIKGIAGPPARDIIDRMNANVHELAQTVENVLEYALAYTNPGAWVEEKIDLAQFFAEVDETLGASMRNPALILRINLDGAPRTVVMHRRSLRSIVLNLANNAVKFTAGGEVNITVCGHEAPRSLSIEVRDTGQGISSDLLSAAFEPLVQLSHSSIRRHRGLGLGLTLVRHNVKSLGARMDVESEPGVGSCFKVTIPCSDSAS